MFNRGGRQTRPKDTLRFNATVRNGAVEDGFYAATQKSDTWIESH